MLQSPQPSPLPLRPVPILFLLINTVFITAFFLPIPQTNHTLVLRQLY